MSVLERTSGAGASFPLGRDITDSLAPGCSPLLTTMDADGRASGADIGRDGHRLSGGGPLRWRSMGGFVTGSNSGANAMIATTQAEIVRSLGVDVLWFMAIDAAPLRCEPCWPIIWLRTGASRYRPTRCW